MQKFLHFLFQKIGHIWDCKFLGECDITSWSQWCFWGLWKKFKCQFPIVFQRNETKPYLL